MSVCAKAYIGMYQNRYWYVPKQILILGKHIKKKRS